MRIEIQKSKKKRNKKIPRKPMKTKNSSKRPRRKNIW
jgi:hypothetical protein